MKYRIALAINLSALSVGSYATTLCQEKEQDVWREISYAERHNNQGRINGLNEVLSEARANYTDSKLYANRQKETAKQRNEVAERQRGLTETKREGDAEKVAKYEHELVEVQQELKELETRDY